MIVDRLAQLTTNIGKVLDTLEESYPMETRSKALNDYIECCRQFCTEGSIPSYPDWLEQLRSLSSAITPAVQISRSRQAAQSTTSLIEDVSYGAAEEEHIEESERILRAIRQSRR
jgi:hypothetical protein